MTVIGIAGCTALIVTGFGIADSISGLANKQFEELTTYTTIVSYADDASQEQKDQLEASLLANSEVESLFTASTSQIDLVIEGQNNQQVTVLAPMEGDFSALVHLRQRRDGKPLTLPESGAIITEKLAKLLGLSVGDTATVKDTTDKTYTFTVAGITENYLEHRLYVSPETYVSSMKKPIIENTVFLKLKGNENEQAAFSRKLNEEKGVLSVMQMGSIVTSFKDTIASLDIITIVLIVSAATLAFIVLYNLSNINISERLRELSTIKVLGFYPKEVSMYIFHELLILTILGIGFGSILGAVLNIFVLKTAEIDLMLFPAQVSWLSYLYSAVLTLVFSSVVMLAMHRKLRKVNMVEALKAEE